MARPVKIGLDYFPVDVKLDEKVEYIQAAHGAVGFMVVIKLWAYIYEKAHFAEWTDTGAMLFAHRNNISPEQLNQVLETCLDIELFDSEMFKNYSILTSRGIQRRYFNVYKSSKRSQYIDKYIYSDIYLEFIGVKAEETKVNPESMPQSKVKESKGKETKGESTVTLSEFDSFWEQYPKQDAEADAEKAFREINPSAELLHTILDSLESQKKSEQWTKENGRYIPLASKWLRGRRWEDQGIKRDTSLYKLFENYKCVD